MDALHEPIITLPIEDSPYHDNVIGSAISPHEVVVGEAWPVPHEIGDIRSNMPIHDKYIALGGLHKRAIHAKEQRQSELAAENAALVERVVSTDASNTSLNHALAKSEQKAAHYRNVSERGQFGNLYNKRTFNKLGRRIIDHDQRPERDYPKIVVFCDIDHLNELNATVGETVVDIEVLGPTAKIMGRKSRGGSVLTGQMGGDEYAQIIQGMSVKETVNYLRARQKEINAIKVNRSFVGAAAIDQIGLTIAYAVVRPEESFKDVMIRADRAKKYAKEVTGRNSIINADDVPPDWTYVRKARAS